MMNRFSNRFKTVGLHLGDNDDSFFTLVSVNTEGNHIAGAHTFYFTYCSLNIFWEYIAAANDDHIFNSTANH